MSASSRTSTWTAVLFISIWALAVSFVFRRHWRCLRRPHRRRRATEATSLYTAVRESEYRIHFLWSWRKTAVSPLSPFYDQIARTPVLYLYETSMAETYSSRIRQSVGLITPQQRNEKYGGGRGAGCRKIYQHTYALGRNLDFYRAVTWHHRTSHIIAPSRTSYSLKW